MVTGGGADTLGHIVDVARELLRSHARFHAVFPESDFRRSHHQSSDFVLGHRLAVCGHRQFSRTGIVRDQEPQAIHAASLPIPDDGRFLKKGYQPRVAIDHIGEQEIAVRVVSHQQERLAEGASAGREVGGK